MNTILLSIVIAVGLWAGQAQAAAITMTDCKDEAISWTSNVRDCRVLKDVEPMYTLGLTTADQTTCYWHSDVLHTKAGYETMRTKNGLYHSVTIEASRMRDYRVWCVDIGENNPRAMWVVVLVLPEQQGAGDTIEYAAFPRQAECDQAVKALRHAEIAWQYGHEEFQCVYDPDWKRWKDGK